MEIIFEVIIGIFGGLLELVFDKDKRSSGDLYKVEKGTSYKPSNREEYLKNKRLMNNLKFSTLLFIHIMYEEDNKLSFGELREIKEIVKKKEGYLTKSDLKELKQLMKRRPSLYEVIEYAKNNHITYSYVQQMINHIRIAVKEETRYDYVLDKVQRRFIVERDYLD